MKTWYLFHEIDGGETLVNLDEIRWIKPLSNGGMRLSFGNGPPDFMDVTDPYKKFLDFVFKW